MAEQGVGFDTYSTLLLEVDGTSLTGLLLGLSLLEESLGHDIGLGRDGTRGRMSEHLVAAKGDPPSREVRHSSILDQRWARLVGSIGQSARSHRCTRVGLMGLV